MLIYDRRKDETIDIQATSYYWEYEDAETSPFFKAIAAKFPECDLHEVEWARFGDGEFVKLEDRNEPDSSPDGKYLEPRFAIITDANHMVRNITKKHLEQFKEYDDIRFDMDRMNDEIWYMQGQVEDMAKKLKRIRKAIDWEA
jgi:hypothetical protein